MNTICIDVETHDANNIMRRLQKLVSTQNVTNGGMYHQDVNYTQLYVETTKTEDEIDNWLYKNNFDYVGTFVP